MRTPDRQQGQVFDDSLPDFVRPLFLQANLPTRPEGYRPHEIQTLWLQLLRKRSPQTFAHSRRVAELTGHLAQLLRPGADEFCQQAKTAALLHDVGKSALAPETLHKTGALTGEEWGQMYQHPGYGAAMVACCCCPDIVRAVRNHHERIDGNGYPDRLRGEEISLLSRMISVADAFDAMTFPRSYRSALSEKEALDVLRGGAGIQWDEEVVSTLTTLLAFRSAERKNATPGLCRVNPGSAQKIV